MALPSLLEQDYGFGERENMSMQAEQAGMRMFSAWRERSGAMRGFFHTRL